MKKIIIFVLIFTSITIGYSQKAKKHLASNSFCIYYTNYYNGKTDEESNQTILTQVGNRCTIKDVLGKTKMIPQVPEEIKTFISDSSKVYQTATFVSKEKIMYVTDFDRFPKLELTKKKDTVLGVICNIYTTNIRSNTIDVSVWESKTIRATPLPSFGIPNGVALRIVMNGTSEIRATKISENNQVKNIDIPKGFKEITSTEYRTAITNGYITNIPVFSQQQICFGCMDSVVQTDNLIQTIRVAHGTLVLKKINIPSFQNGLLFAELTEFSNGDAYDRTGSVFMIPARLPKTFLEGCLEGVDKLPYFTAKNGKKYQGMVATENYEPIVELIRFFTPFGVNHFNTQVAVDGIMWADSAFYKQDITPLMPLLKGEVWIGAFIGNYDKGGHIINLSLKHYPETKEVTTEVSKTGAWVKPLFCTNNVLEMASQEYALFFDQDTLRIEFEIPSDITNVKLRYITTGHGGWENGDEFNQKENKIFIDDQKIHGFIPWRCDCATYRQLNPASGNFWNGVTSSDYSRSGWCPGTATNPIDIAIPALSAGKHVLKVAIDQGKAEGSSFNSWNISGVLIGDKK